MRRPAYTIAFAVTLAGMTCFASGCGRSRKEAAANTPGTPVANKPAAPNIDVAKIRPNELGRIPVIMYHEIGGKPVASDPALVRPIEAFKKDVELMYAAGFRPVNLSDVINNNINLPAGTSPIVLTFDDARESQFRLIETATELKIDPNCAMGILQAFHKQHPDWQMRATFFILPKSYRTLEPFGQLGMGSQKLSYLLEQGMEIGNHTVNHQDMSKMTPEQIQAEIGGAHNRILEAAPKADLQVVALPLGRFPKDPKSWQHLLKGTYEGKPYQYKAAMTAAYRAVPSPVSKDFDPQRLERIASRDDRWGVRWWIQELSRGTGEYPRYISDGDPTFVSIPQGLESQVNVARLQAENKTLFAYSPFGGAGGAKPIVGVGAPAGAAPSANAPAVTEKPITGG